MMKLLTAIFTKKKDENKPSEITEAPISQENPELESTRSVRKKRSLSFSDILLLSCALLFLISALCAAACRISPAFAELFCGTLSPAVRYAVGYISSPLPFSLCESIIFITPFAVIYLFVSRFRRSRRENNPKILLSFVKKLAAVLLALNSVINFGFIPLYSRKPVNEYIGIERRDITAKELEYTYRRVTEELNKLAESGEIMFDSEGFSVMPYSFDALGDKINEAYSSLCGKNGFGFLTKMNVKAKPLLCSEYMTYTHLSGVYTAFTGEANINTNYPDYIVAFTYAHELAHQRGVAPEDEASFTAYLALLESDDKYLNYCAYRYVWDYLQTSLYIADKDACLEILRLTDSRLLSESAAYSRFFDKYRDSAASEVAEAVNDTSLKLNNEKAGTQSYGMVVDLIAATFVNQADRGNNQ